MMYESSCTSASILLCRFNVRETSLDLYLLYLEVTRRGGFHQVCILYVHFSLMHACVCILGTFCFFHYLHAHQIYPSNIVMSIA